MRRFRMLLVIVAGILLVRSIRRSPAADDSLTLWAEAASAPDPFAAPRPAPTAPRPAMTAPDALPLERYDELRAVDIAASIRSLGDAEEVQRILDYEAAHHQRVTVFRAAKARLRALEGAAQSVSV